MCLYTKKTYFCRTLLTKTIQKVMQELIAKVAGLYAAFEKDAKAQAENGNKAAGMRARKVSLEIERAMKAFRKASLEAVK